MTNAYKIFLCATLLFFTEGAVLAQTRFSAKVLTGVNLSQIDGDRQQGYRKRGLSLGLNGSIFIAPDFDVSTELWYNQKGADYKKPAGFGEFPSTISLNYSEVALLFNYHFLPNRTEQYYTQSLHVGLSYGRLLGSSTAIFKDNQPLTQLETEVTSRSP